ncbi:uncharacterized protein LOC132639282 [Lycium barbarum]|uniref:uncharacterized protein LOC132639282 n=1 Tax=Lycium barbarum TaxID=112863 RepID=UPI00293E6B63|nr:uncharacterized protein LOC132639282 [Lycium barbarum]
METSIGKRSSNPYIPPKGQLTKQRSSKLESILEKVLANQDKVDRTLNGLTETVGSHAIFIQKLESQMKDISREQHLLQKGGLPSDTIPNPKNGGGGSAEKKVIELKPIVEEEEAQSDVLTIIEEVPTKIPIVEKVADIPKSSKKTETSDTCKQTVKGDFRPLTQLLKSKPPFPQRLVKKTEYTKCQRFYDQLKQLSMNVPFLDVVKEIPEFAKYLKDLLTKKRSVKHDTVSLTHHVSLILSTITIHKKKDLGAFTIPCVVGHHDLARAFCDNGASINLMPLVIYKQSGLGMPRPTTMQLKMADRSIKRPVGVIDDVLVWVGDILLPADFVILDCGVDRDIIIILGRPFLATGRTLMDSEKNEIKF